MKRTTAALLLVVGAGVTGNAVHSHLTRYGNDAIWGRVRPIVESRVKDPGRKAAIYDQLRTVLSETKGESAEKRCRYERLLEATLIHGSVPAAENAIKARSYEPYSECEPAGQLKQDASKGYNVAGALALVAGAISLVVSLFRKNKAASPDIQ